MQCDFSVESDTPISNNDKVYLVNFIFLCISVIIVIIVVMFVVMLRCRDPAEEASSPTPGLGELQGELQGELALVGSPSDYTLTLMRRSEVGKH